MDRTATTSMAMPVLTRERPIRPVVTDVDLDVLPDLLGFNLRLAQLSLQRRLLQSMSGSDVGSGLFGLMVLCGANPGIAQVQVAEHLNIDKASVVSLVDRLEQSGWLVRRRSGTDRRRHGLFLTQEGERELVSLKARVRDSERLFDGQFDPDERRLLLRLLQRMHP